MVRFEVLGAPMLLASPSMLFDDPEALEQAVVLRFSYEGFCNLLVVPALLDKRDKFLEFLLSPTGSHPTPFSQCLCEVKIFGFSFGSLVLKPKRVAARIALSLGLSPHGIRDLLVVEPLLHEEFPLVLLRIRPIEVLLIEVCQLLNELLVVRERLGPVRVGEGLGAGDDVSLCLRSNGLSDLLVAHAS